MPSRQRGTLQEFCKGAFTTFEFACCACSACTATDLFWHTPVRRFWIWSQTHTSAAKQHKRNSRGSGSLHYMRSMLQSFHCTPINLLLCKAAFPLSRNQTIMTDVGDFNKYPWLSCRGNMESIQVAKQFTRLRSNCLPAR